MTAFIPKTDLEWREDLLDLFERLAGEDAALSSVRDEIESIVRQIREEAIRAHGNGEGAQ
jgi:hypothetical protein